MELNTGVILGVLFIFQIFSLYLFSRLLIQTLGRLFIRVTGSHTKAVNMLAFFFLLGTFVHEAAHAFTATLMLVTVHDFHLMPKIEEGGIKLGSVEITKSDPFRRAFIGVAPVIFGVSLLLLITWLLETKIPLEVSSWWLYLILGYCIFVVSNTMFSSKKDMEGAILVIVLLICTTVALILFKWYQPFIFLAQFLNTQTPYLLKLNIYILVPILVDIFVYGIFKLFKMGR